MMKYVIICLVLLWATTQASCTKQKVIDTGTSSGRYDGNMLEYLKSDAFNWRLTVEMIERAGLQQLFEGKDPAYPAITFLGFTSLSVERLLYDSQYKDSSDGIFNSVQDIPVDLARKIVLEHVVPTAFKREDVNFNDKLLAITDPRQPVSRFLTIQGTQILAYRESTAYNGIPDAGPVYLRLHGFNPTRNIPVASADIEPNNGVVHSLNYTYEILK